MRNITKKGEGVSTLEAREIWFDPTVRRLNVNGAGDSLGRFSGRDRVFTLTQSGYVRLSGQDLSTHFDDDMIEIRKYNARTIVTILHNHHLDAYIPKLLGFAKPAAKYSSKH